MKDKKSKITIENDKDRNQNTPLLNEDSNWCKFNKL